jgi:hypothetical protein
MTEMRVKVHPLDEEVIGLPDITLDDASSLAHS